VVLGVGSIGERHLRCFQTTGRTELAIVEPNPTLRQTVAERYGISQAFASLAEAWEFRPTAAVVATPAPYHIPLSTELAERKVHLLIEKPLSTSVEGIDRLQQVVRENHVTVALAYVLRMYPVLQALKSAVGSGRFGRPVQLVAVGGQNFPTYRPAYRDIYYRDRALGGGAIQDALTHTLNAGEWLVGPIDRLLADAAHQVLDGVEVEDTVHVLTRQGNVMGSYSLNQHQPANESTLTVICERGMVRGEFHLNRWRWTERPDEPWHDEPLEVAERDTHFIAQAVAFLDAVEGRRSVACTLEEGLQTLRVNLAALASLESTVWQPVEPNGGG
jgi:predicted dehydrogenase